MIFALHPIQTEAVAWASSSYTPMCGMFSLAAIWQFLHYSECLTQGHRRTAWVHYTAASVFFILAMLTKPAAASAPLILAAIEIFWRRRPVASVALPLGFWVVLAIPIIIATKIGAPANTVRGYEWWQRIVVALDAIAFYMGKIVWPVRLSPDYGRAPVNVMDNPTGWWTCAISVAIGMVAWLVKRHWPGATAALGVFVAGLLPTLGFATFDFQTFSTVADRFTYLAMLGGAMFVAVLLSRMTYKLVAPFAVVAVAGLGTLSFLQLPVWQNAWTLFAYTIQVRPQSRIVGGDVEFMLTEQYEAHCTLSPAQLTQFGDGLMNQRRSFQAASIYELAIARGSRDAATHGGLARAQLENEKLAAAERAARQALELNPNDAAACVILGNIYIRTDVLRAAEQYQKALSIDPANPEARRGLAAVGKIK
jgi:hypothetical protein